MRADLVLIVGAGGTGRDVLAWIRAGLLGLPQNVGFLDDNRALWGTSVDGAPVLGALAAAAEHTGAGFIDALGGPRSFPIRQKLVDHIPDERFLTPIHPSAHI